MKKIKSLLLVALLMICSASVFVACGEDKGAAIGLAEAKSIIQTAANEDQTWQGTYIHGTNDIYMKIMGQSDSTVMNMDIWSAGTTVSEAEMFYRTKAAGQTQELYLINGYLHNISLKQKMEMTDDMMKEQSESTGIIALEDIEDFDASVLKAYRKELSDGQYKITLDLNLDFMQEMFNPIFEAFGGSLDAGTVTGEGFVQYTFDASNKLISTRVKFEMNLKLGDIMEMRIKMDMTATEYTDIIPQPVNFNTEEYTEV